MTKPAFIVEGYQEQKIVQTICANSKVVLLGSNGNAVNINHIFKKIKAHVKIFNNRYYPIFVIFDREDRKLTCEEIIDEIFNLLENEGMKKDQFIFGIPDRKIESWIIPFIDPNGCFTDDPVDEFEGKNCLGKLEKRLQETGEAYNKSTNGIRLFTKIHPEKLAQVSSSFAYFYRSAKEHCIWMRR